MPFQEVLRAALRDPERDVRKAAGDTLLVLTPTDAIPSDLSVVPAVEQEASGPGPKKTEQPGAPDALLPETKLVPDMTPSTSERVDQPNIVPAEMQTKTKPSSNNRSDPAEERPPGTSVQGPVSMDATKKPELHPSQLQAVVPTPPPQPTAGHSEGGDYSAYVPPALPPGVIALSEAPSGLRPGRTPALAASFSSESTWQSWKPTPRGQVIAASHPPVRSSGAASSGQLAPTETLPATPESHQRTIAASTPH
jgi:hypothetical protein